MKKREYVITEETGMTVFIKDMNALMLKSDINLWMIT